MQMSLQRGIKLLGDRANVYILKFKYKISREERLHASAALIFLKGRNEMEVSNRKRVPIGHENVRKSCPYTERSSL